MTEPNPKAGGVDRRGFLKTAAAGGAALSLAGGAPAIGQAESKLRVATIGSGGRCRELLTGAKLVPEVERRHRLRRLGRRDSRHRQTPRLKRQPQDHKGISRSPQRQVGRGGHHRHARPLARQALGRGLEAGKDVYVEKPLCRTLDEGTVALALAKRYKDRIVQVGQQQRNMPHMRKCFDEIVAEGKLGPVFHTRIWWNYWAYPNPPRRMNIDPKGVDWKRWLGNAPDRPFDAYRFRAWRNFWDTAGGHTTDLATHLIDVVHWYLNVDHPIAATSAGGLYFSKDGRDTPDTIHTLWTYPKNLVVTWQGNQCNGQDGAGIEFFGTNGTLYLDRQLYEWKPRDGKPVVYHDGNLPRGHFNVRPDQDAAHLRDWVRAVRDRKPPRVPIELGVNAAGTTNLSNLSYRTGGAEVRWPEA